MKKEGEPAGLPFDLFVGGLPALFLFCFRRAAHRMAV